MSKPILESWAIENKARFESLEIFTELVDGLEHSSKAEALDLSTKTIGGRISYWPTGVFEFQFHDLSNGNVIHLEERPMDINDLFNYFENILDRMNKKIEITTLQR